jgi:pseudo-rSAM protein
MEKALIIKSNTFIWKNNDEALFYDSDAHKAKIYSLTKSSAALCDELCNPDNLYSVQFDADSTDDSLLSFVNSLKSDGFGTLADAEQASHIVSLPPMLNIQKSWEFVKSAYDLIDSQILHYLKSLTIYVGGACKDNEWHLQTIFPVCSNEVIRKDDILDFINKACSNYILEINIVFSSIGEYSEVGELIEGLKKYGKKVNVYLTAEDALENRDMLQTIVENSDFNLVILCSNNNFFYPSNCPKDRLKISYFVKSERDYEKATEHCKMLPEIDQDFVPIYNGCNLDFFRKNVLMTNEEIMESALSKREIFLHMALNANYFGKLIVMPDRTVHADTNRVAIGNMDDSVYYLIANEMNMNTAWMMTRENNSSCKNCLLRFLCPSPSSYEEVMRLKCICSDKIGGEADNI